MIYAKPERVETSDARIVVITPSMASRLLEKNICNRPLRMRTVLQYAEAIKAGRWDLNGEAVKIANTGSLFDGQHRLHAIVIAGIPIKTWVIGGIDPGATVDDGLKRSSADRLAMAGEKHPKLLASSARIVDRWFHVRDSSLFNEAVTLSEHPDLRAGVADVAGSKALRGVFASNATGAALCYILRTDNETLCAKFMESLATGVNLNATAPVYTLRERLLRRSVHLDRKAAADTPDMVGALVILSWKKTKQRKTLKRVSLPKTDPLPYIRKFIAAVFGSQEEKQ